MLIFFDPKKLHMQMLSLTLLLSSCQEWGKYCRMCKMAAHRDTVRLHINLELLDARSHSCNNTQDTLKIKRESQNSMVLDVDPCLPCFFCSVFPQNDATLLLSAIFKQIK